MNSITRRLSWLPPLTTAFFLALATLLSGCGGGSAAPTSPSGPSDLVVSPSRVTGNPGQVLSFVVSGGTPGYKVSSNNSSVAGVSDVQSSGGQYIFTATLKGIGSNTLTITDSGGKVQTVDLTVMAGSAVPLHTSAPSAITIPVGGGARSFTIGGGAAPYTASSSNTSVATVGVNGTALTITGVAAGTASVVVLDSSGASVTIAVTIGSGGADVPLFTTAPAAITITVGGALTSFTVAGGTAPYVVTSSNTSIATASISGTTLTITGVTAGAANIVVHDATGTTVTIAVSVGGGGAATPLYTTAPGAITIAVGGTPTYTIAGGTAPYTATSSNTAVATVSVSSPTLVITGVAAGLANIVVYDANGTSVTINVTVANSAGIALYTTAPAAVTIAAIGGAQTYAIGGGTAPYSVASSNTNIVTGSVSGTALTITGVADGAANIQVRDASGTATVTIVVNVATGGGFRVITPSISWTIGGNGDSDLTNDCPAGVVPPYSVYFINGGIPPYTVSSNQPLIAAVLSAPPTAAQSVQAAGTTVTVAASGGYFVATWPNANNNCAWGVASFKVIDSTGTVLPEGAPTFTITFTPS